MWYELQRFMFHNEFYVDDEQKLKENVQEKLYSMTNIKENKNTVRLQRIT